MMGRFVGLSNGNWPLGANSNDISGNANNGTDTDISYRQYELFGSANFNGSSSKILLTNTAALKPTTFTIFWWMLTTSAATGAIISNFEPTYYGYKFVIESGAIRAEVGVGTNPPARVTSGAVVNDGKPHFVALVFDGSNLKVYVDGKYDNSVAGSIGYTATQYPVIGCWRYASTTYSEYYSGSLSQVVVLPYVCTDSDIRRLYAYGKGCL